MPEARYDGAAQWYEECASRFAEPFATALATRVSEVGRRGDPVLDVGCGTGLYFDALRARGLRPFGIDISADQLGLARRRVVDVVRADAGVLPIRCEAIPLAVAAFVHTDVDRFSSAVVEIARVLKPGGRFVCVGTHPCFVGTFITRTDERDGRTLEIRAGYGNDRVAFGDRGTSGLSSRVGFRNLSLGAFVGAFLGAGLRIESFEELDTRAQQWSFEPEDRTIAPWNILIVAVKP
jgi:SAM-dependent methyltransferase